MTNSTVFSVTKPTSEPRQTLRDKIRACRRSSYLQTFGHGSVAFIISRVGSAPEAEYFISELKSDPELDQTVFCSTDRLDVKMDSILQKSQGDVAYTRHVSLTMPSYASQFSV